MGHSEGDEYEPSTSRIRRPGVSTAAPAALLQCREPRVGDRLSDAPYKTHPTDSKADPLSQLTTRYRTTHPTGTEDKRQGKKTRWSKGVRRVSGTRMVPGTPLSSLGVPSHAGRRNRGPRVAAVGAERPRPTFRSSRNKHGTWSMSGLGHMKVDTCGKPILPTFIDLITS